MSAERNRCFCRDSWALAADGERLRVHTPPARRETDAERHQRQALYPLVLRAPLAALTPKED